MSEPAPEVRTPSLLERYGTAAVVTILALFAIEMVVLTPMVRWGVDLSPLARWIQSTFDVTLDLGEGAPSWPMAAAVAYAITRPLKPIQLAIAAALTPFVARLLPTAPDPTAPDA